MSDKISIFFHYVDDIFISTGIFRVDNRYKHSDDQMRIDFWIENLQSESQKFQKNAIINFGPRVYPKGSLVIALVRVCVLPSLNISETVH